MRGPTNQDGMTLIELLVVASILAILAGIGIPMYTRAIDHARQIKVVQEIKQIGRDITAYAAIHGGKLPETLADIDHGGRRDPWGTPYYYLNFQTGTGSGASLLPGAPDTVGPDLNLVADSSEQLSRKPGGGSTSLSTTSLAETPDTVDSSVTLTGLKRKDKMLVPLNSDYDLYSAGPDRSTMPPLTAPVSSDDILRANDGAFIGKAADY